MCVFQHVRVFVCVSVCISVLVFLSEYVCVLLCIRMVCVCVCMCVYECECVCVCVCVHRLSGGASSAGERSAKDYSSQLIDGVGTSEYSVILRRQLIRSHRGTSSVFSLPLSLPLILSLSLFLPLSLLLSLSLSLIISLSHLFCLSLHLSFLFLLFFPAQCNFPLACLKATPAMVQIRQQHNYEYICILRLIRTSVMAAPNLFHSDNFKS